MKEMMLVQEVPRLDNIVDLLGYNNIAVTGTIKSDQVFNHGFFGEMFDSFVLETKRFSGVADLLPVLIPQRIWNEKKLEVGMSVSISGQIRSYNKRLESRRRHLLMVYAREADILSQKQEEDKNQVMFNGYICKAPTYRVTPKGREITDALMAVNRAPNRSDYIPIIFWGKNARFAKSLNVGDGISILGRMQSREYTKAEEGKDATVETAYEISVSSIIKKDSSIAKQEPV